LARIAHVSETPATRMLRARGVDFTAHPYSYQEHGGTAHSAAALGLDEYQVVKTLIMEDESAEPLIVLMHGTHRVLTKELARALGAKRIAPCAPATAERHTGYLIGGTSPFGTRRVMPVYVERTILECERIYLNGGRRGYLVGIAPAVLVDVLGAIPVSCGMLD
jgi:Cys-tRNA(Pro) deacylase